MVEKISVQIALEGGAEVQRQLEGIGEAGQKAFADITKAAEQAGGFKNLDPSVATQKLKEFGVTGVNEIQKVQKALSTAVRFENLVQGVQSAQIALVRLGTAAGIAGAAVAAAFVAMAKPTIAFANTINKASDQAAKLGMSLTAFKKFQQDFQKLGVSGEAAASGFAKFQQELQKAAQADPGSNLALFGQTTEAAKAQLDQFLERLRQMPDGLQRTNLAISQLGEAAGTQFIQGLRAAEGSMTADERKAYDLGQALAGLKAAWDQFGTLAFAPALTAGIDAATTAVNALINALASGDFSAVEATFRELLTNIGQLLQNALPTFLAAGQAFANALLDGMKNAFTPGSLDSLFNAILADFQKFGESLVRNWEILKQRLGFGSAGASASGGGGGSAPGMAHGGMVGGRGTGISDSNLAWVSRGEHVMPAHVVRRPGMLSFLEALRRGRGIPGYAAGGAVGGFSFDLSTFVQVFNSTIGLLQSAVQAVRQLQQGFNNSMARMVDSINSLATPFNQGMDGIAQLIVQAADNLQKLNVQGRAHGGLIGGRGTGTSDSNLAWLSRGEFVMPARIVQQRGMLAFLEMLRGGLMPRFAAGGAVGMSHVTIQFPGLPPVAGLRASTSVVNELHRAAALAQVRSGGRKPSRYS